MARFIFPVLLGLVGVIVLGGLGVWQLQRLAWKEGLLAEIEARIAEAPTALPETPTEAQDAFRAVTFTATAKEPGIAVFGTWRQAGAGYRIIKAVDTGDRRVLVDFGVAATAEAAIPATPLTITGNLNFPAETEPTPEAAVWTRLDVLAMAARLGTEPVLVTASAVSGGTLPTTMVPVGTEGIPNSHLGYAIQWFGLAIVWAGMTAFLLWRMTARTNRLET